MKRLIYVGCFAVLLVAAGACKEKQDELGKGKVGEVEWRLKGETLTFSGKGAIPDDWGEKHWRNSTLLEYWTDAEFIKAIVIEEGITSIGISAFWRGNFSYITIPNSVTSIGSNAFLECENLKSVKISNSVTSIEYGTFMGCKNLESVTIGNGVKTIGDGAFLGCCDLSFVYIGNNVTTIESNAFWGCHSLKSVVIPNSVTSIEYGAFENCYELKFLTIGSGVTSFGEGAFKNCGNLTYITNLNPVPAYIDITIFLNVYKKYCELKVPASAVSAYQNAEVWKEFNIVGM